MDAEGGAASLFLARLVFAEVASVFGRWGAVGGTGDVGAGPSKLSLVFFLSTGRTGAKGWFEVHRQVSAFSRPNGGVSLFSFDDGGARGGCPGERVVFCRFSCFGGFAVSV